jgi:hypothetical protein
VARAMPLLEAVEYAALRAGVPVDSRIEKGRCRLPTAAPRGSRRGHDWILTHAPVETLVLRPAPEPLHRPSRSAAFQARFPARRLKQLNRVS